MSANNVLPSVCKECGACKYWEAYMITQALGIPQRGIHMPVCYVLAEAEEREMQARATEAQAAFAAKVAARHERIMTGQATKEDKENTLEYPLLTREELTALGNL